MSRIGIAPPSEIADPHTIMPYLPEVEPGTLPMTKELEATQRIAIVREAMSWIGTPYRQQADIKGLKGCVDCSMLLVRCWVDAGIFKPFDPRPYSPSWHLHKDDERYLEWLQTLAQEVDEPRAGDIVCWRFGRCFSHGGVMIDDLNAVQASMMHGVTFVDSIESPWLRYMKDGRNLRPRVFFDIWAGIRSKFGGS
jgi:hypothetical protein